MPNTKSSKDEAPIGNPLQKGLTASDEAFFSNDNDEAPYYCLKNKRSREVKRIADLLPQLEEFREEFRVDVTKELKDSVESALQEWIQIEQKIREHAGNPFLVDLVRMVLTGDANNLNRLAKAFEATQPGRFRCRSRATSAAIWAIIACDALYSEGRRAGSVTQQDVIRMALQLQREYEDRMNAGAASRGVGERTVAFMPADDPWLGKQQPRSIKWERIFRDLGINLKKARRGRKTNREREERNKQFNKAKTKILTPSK